ncbi:MAG TPA: AMP-binding protein [Acidimicrobiales bacterium]|nr:AMP-binding protein [Acidimicrobiales bacterium]
MSRWNFADVWEVVADMRPDAPAVVQGSRQYSWADFDRRADGIAAGLLGFGVKRQTSVAQYLYNCPEYLETVYAAFKAGLVPVNTNYRYVDDELAYLWDNADVAVVVFHGAFAERVASVRPRVPEVRAWLWVDDGSGPCPEWAVPYEDLASSNPAQPPTRAPWGRSPDDLYLLYTGGTTGLPKGVMWRQDDLFAVLNRSAGVRYPEEGTLDDVRAVLDTPRHPLARVVPCPPLMHGSASFTCFPTFAGGGGIFLLTSRSFSATELLDTVQRERITELTIVGDAFAKPILRELDSYPDRWDISSLWLIVSSGVMWAAETKSGLLKHNSRLLCIDTLGSSEAVGVASSRSSRKGTVDTGGFVLNPNTRVIREDGSDIVPGSGERGLLATRGRTPVGYYKDPEKSAATFRLIGGVCWTVPGDWATVDVSGIVQLLGRGSVCINTGGEKVFPEEVEEVVKTYPLIADAVVVGVPDERFGEAIVAMVEPLGASAVLEEDDVIAHVKGRLASYKAPRRVLAVETIGRDTNGKADYRRLKAEATERVGADG